VITQKFDPTKGHGAAMTTVQAFYMALGAGNGEEASKFVLPEKRSSGAFSPSAITNFYSRLIFPLTLLDIRPINSDEYRVRYTYVAPGTGRCNGESVVRTTKVDGMKSVTETYNAISRDGISLTAFINIRFRLTRDAVPQLHQSIGPNYIEALNIGRMRWVAAWDIAYVVSMPLMTALSACIGLLPAAVSTGIGSQVQRPLATVVVGGLLIGPIMLLVVVPPLRLMFLGRDGDSQPTSETGVPNPAQA
jgi:hypothetical protein